MIARKPYNHILLPIALSPFVCVVANPSFSEYDTVLSLGPERRYRKLKPYQAYHTPNHPFMLSSRTLYHTGNLSIHVYPIRSSSCSPYYSRAITHTAYIIPQTSASCSETVAQTSPTRKASKQTTNQAATWPSPPLSNPLDLLHFSLSNIPHQNVLQDCTTSSPWLHGSTTLRCSDTPVVGSLRDRNGALLDLHQYLSSCRSSLDSHRGAGGLLALCDNPSVPRSSDPTHPAHPTHRHSAYYS